MVEAFDVYLKEFHNFAGEVENAQRAKLFARIFDLLVGALQLPIDQPIDRPADMPRDVWERAQLLLGSIRATANTPELRTEAILAGQTSAAVLRVF